MQILGNLRYLGSLETLEKYKNQKNMFNLSKKGSLEEAARNLYKTLRKIKKWKIQLYLRQITYG